MSARIASVFFLAALAALLVSARPGGAQGPQNISLALVIDNSGSMAQTDPADLRFAAASQIVDLLESGDEISLVLFADGGSVLVPLTRVTDGASKEPVRSALAPVPPAGNTNMRAGLEAALTELEKGTNPVRFAIFLTDGQLHPPGWPSFTPEEQKAERNAVLGLASQFGGKEWGLFPVSLASAVEPEFLQALAQNGGGLYRQAPEAGVLALVFQEVFAARKLDVFEILFSDCVGQGEERTVTFPVHQFVSTLSLFVTYPGDPRPTVTVASPDGAPVAPTGGDARYDAFSVQSPARGTWTVKVTGSAVGQSCVSISSTPRALVEVVWLRPAASLSLALGAPLEIAVRLTATEPQTGEQRPVENAKVSVKVTGPDGQSYDASLGETGGGEYAGPVAVSGAEGLYRIELVAETDEGIVARGSFPTTVSAGAAATPEPTVTPAATAATGEEGGGFPLALVVIVLALVVGSGVAYGGYCRFFRPLLRGYLESVPPGRAYDLETRQRHTWWRRPLTIGGPGDDVDVGLGGTWARIMRRRNGDCILQALAAGGALVDRHQLRRGQKRRLFHRSELSLGGMGLVYRLHAAGPRTGRWE